MTDDTSNKKKTPWYKTKPFIVGIIILFIIIIAVTITGSQTKWFGIKEKFLINQPKSDLGGDFSMKQEFAKLDILQKQLLKN